MLTVALAGKPNAGKSTFFSAATAADVDVANYPFTTIDPNRGVSYVRTECPCLDRELRCEAMNCREGKRYVPIELIDVAGLVPGAHEGRGLGNQFLDELSDADVIVTVVDASGGTNAEGEPVPIGTADPVAEVTFIEEEMDEWLAGIVERNWERVTRASRAPDFDFEETLIDVLSGVGAGPGDVAAVLRKRDYPATPQAWDAEDRLAIAQELRQRTKPMVVAANKIDVAPPEQVEALLALDRPIIPTTAEGERALRKAAEANLIQYDPGDTEFAIVGEVTEAQREGLEQISAAMKEHGGTGVQQTLNHAIFEELDRITVYPVENESKWTDGNDQMLPDAFLLPAESTPPDLAFAVHTDIGEGYLHAVDARSNRRIGEGHGLADGDVIKIVSTN